MIDIILKGLPMNGIKNINIDDKRGIFKTTKFILNTFGESLSVFAKSMINELAAMQENNNADNIVEHNTAISKAVDALIEVLIEAQAKLEAFGDNPLPVIKQAYVSKIERASLAIEILNKEELVIYR
jgi:hypothetical protein